MSEEGKNKSPSKGKIQTRSKPIKRSAMQATPEEIAAQPRRTLEEAKEQYHRLKKAASKKPRGGSLWNDLT